jgi:HPt (histidine-containing phosphotransfer) domain-containing protein
MEKLEAAIAAGDQEVAIRLAHSLKGAAATLRINHLAADAKHVEFALRALTAGTLSEAHVDSDISAIDDEFAALAKVFTPPVAESLPTELLATLEAQLQDQDAAAAILFKENSAPLRAALGPGCDALTDQIGQFDFSAALDTLRALRQAAEHRP